MENSLTFLAEDLVLKQSELFRDEYVNSEINQVHTFNELSVSDLDDWYNSILMKFSFLNEIQVKNIQGFLKALGYVLGEIDPNKLEISLDSVEDSDLMLWRESNHGISMITFDEYGQIVYSFIGKNGKKIKGTFDQNIDMEKLLYKFISA
ncbi:hypothetical protein [Flavobacterium terrae]|uniref:Uncharacterized protein n=1 Tax=Flavobacterium terrae TaxID=415425 RepID=A0A1M6AMV2_9FLAO|nr:hypothetical protein [Flavobacterium terrae]SHI37727.1 hypothetical protein SAMN05444363_0299 [Flavobacterium terrae]